MVKRYKRHRPILIRLMYQADQYKLSGLFSFVHRALISPTFPLLEELDIDEDPQDIFAHTSPKLKKLSIAHWPLSSETELDLSLFTQLSHFKYHDPYVHGVIASSSHHLVSLNVEEAVTAFGLDYDVDEAISPIRDTGCVSVLGGYREGWNESCRAVAE
ncbi:hypothetical protein BT96DRAFT_992934 [Gymnopus androsaceus JB14]|uniref:F-box domain-containing protein n=1 Tax=Gymnopus androsaceus JB14 TaxID=1447944 RepID=A0A6A4HRQ0_9AGAR|nr:hypothetical protein BT96DRAFT_992934 [Gymnopus androsaceus JB14]